jgi:dihydroneopterin aldolase
VDKILLRGLEFFGRHGCLEAERVLGQKFVVDVEVAVNLSRAGNSDSLADTLDYVRVFEIAREEIEGEPRNLLEAVATRIAQRVLEDERAQSIRVRIAKPHVALPATLRFLGVEIVRTREEQ